MPFPRPWPALHLLSNVFPLAAALLSLACGSPVEAQTPAAQPALIVTNYAGGGASCAAATNAVGDGCAATDAIVNSPHIGDFDAAGNFFFTDSYTGANLGRIRRVDARTGTISTVAGGATAVCAAATDSIGDGCPATQATLNVPHGVKLDSAGNLYIADSSNNRIRFVDAQTGIISTLVGTGTSGNGPFSSSTPPAANAIALGAPNDLAVDKAGNLYLSQANSYSIVLVVAVNGRVQAATSPAYALAGTGTSGHTGDGGPASAATIGSGRGVALDSSGNLFFSDYANQRVRKITSPFQNGVLNLAGSIITTYAGIGTTGTSGDGGLATAASVNSPEAVAVDAAGNLYIDCVNAGSAFIRKVDAATGIITSIAGTGAYGNTGDGGLATKATFNGEIGVSVDPFGNIHVVDTSNNRVRKLSPDSSFPATAVGASSISQNLAVTLNQAVTPASFGVPSSSPEYSSSAVNGCTLAASNAAGTSCQTAVAFTPKQAGPRTAPLAFAATPGVALSIGLTGTGLAPQVAFSPATIATVAGTGVQGYGSGSALTAKLNAPGGGFVDAAGNLYFADTANHAVRKLTLASGTLATIAGTGAAGFAGDGAAATSAQVSSPRSVAADAAGNLYIADTGNQRIREVDAQTGIISTIAGTGTAGFAGDGGAATSAQLSSPAGLTFDPLGSLYLADTGNHAIRRVLLGSGVISTVAGTGAAGYGGDGAAATSATLRNPAAVALDPLGNLFIADTGNAVVRRVSAAGIISTIAGTAGIATNSGDGGPATAATLLPPTDLALDPAGTLYVMAGNRVRHIDASGTIATLAGNGAAGGYQGEGEPATAAALGTTANNLFADALGDLFVAATSEQRILFISSAQPATLAFGAQAVASASAPALVLVYNTGNQPLTLTGLTLSGSFQQKSSGGTDCGASTTLAAGASCTLAVVFQPLAPGALTGQIVLADNALNAASTQTLQLSGTGINNLTGFSIAGLAASTTAGSAVSVTVDALGGAAKNTAYRGTIHFTSTDPAATLPADYTYTAADAGEHVFNGLLLKTAGSQSITATDTAQGTLKGSGFTSVVAAAPASIAVSGSASAAATAGTAFAAALAVKLVDLYGNPVPGVTVTFTAPVSGASASFAGGSSASAVSGADGIAASPIPSANATPGSYTVTASAAGLTPVATFALTNLAPRGATVLTLSAATLSPIVGKSFTLTATVGSSASGIPTGLVTFSDGATILGTAAVGAQGTAVYTTSTLALGPHTLTASYAGDTNFLGSQALALTVTVVNQPDFSVSASPSTLTLLRGQSGIYTLTFTPIYNYTGTATVSCGTLPASIHCQLTPSAFTSIGTGTAVQALLAVTTDAALAQNRPEGPGRGASATLLAGLAAALGTGFGRRRRRSIRLLMLPLALSLAGALALSGCGGGRTVADAGTTQIAVTVADSSQGISHTLNLTLTLQ